MTRILRACLEQFTLAAALAPELEIATCMGSEHDVAGSPDLAFIVAKIGESANVAVGDDKAVAHAEEGGKGGESELEDLHFEGLEGWFWRERLDVWFLVKVVGERVLG